MSKSQITQFIALGIIILISGFILFLARDRIFPTQLVSTDFLPVAEYVKTCSEQKTHEAARLMGIQGGYVTLPDSIRYNPLSYISNAGMITPYWYYNGENRMPTRETMEKEISNFVSSKIQECTGNFEGFREQFEITQTGNITAEAKISDDKIDVELTYPLNLKLKGKDQVEEINKIKTTINTRMGRVYDLAKEIMNAENRNTFLENDTVDMIAVSDLPMEGMEIACGKDWSVEGDIKPSIQQMVKYNFHYLNFKNTKYDDSGIDYFRAFYVEEASTKNNRDIRVKTIYNPDFGMDVKVHPSSGDRTHGIDLELTDIVPCLNVYHHFYTIEYPVMFQLTDEKDPENTYNFFFATPVMIDKNVARREIPAGLVDDSMVSITSDDYCSMNDFDTTVFTIDKNTQEELSDTSIEYQCVNFNCQMGKTAQPAYDGIPIAGSFPKLNAKFPRCTNGFLVAKKEGYLEGQVQQTMSEETNGQSITIEMMPLKKFEYSYIIKSGESTRLPAADEVIFTILEDSQNEYRTTVYYPAEDERFGTLQLPVRDATYSVDIKMVVNETVVGGYELENWTVTQSDIEKGNFIGFTAISSDPRPADVQDYVELYKKEIKPDSGMYKPKIE